MRRLPPPIMSTELMREWIESLDIPRIMDISVLRTPAAWYVRFYMGLNTSQINQLRAIGFSCTHVAEEHMRNRYLIRYLEGKWHGNQEETTETTGQ